MKSYALGLFTLAVALPGFAQQKLAYPPAEKQDIVETHFNTQVADPYRWLEDDRSEKTEQWVKLQNQVTENYLSEIPVRTRLKQRLTELWNFNKQSAPFKKGKHFFCFKNNGLQNQSVLYLKKSAEDPGEILLDPNTLSQEGTVSLSGISISKNGKTLAYGISKAGSDWVEIHFMDIEKKKDIPDIIRWVKFSGMSWKGDGIYYSRYAEPNGNELTQKNEFHKVHFHHLGTPQEKDQLVYEDKEHPDYNFGAQVTDDENYLFISTSLNTSGQMLRVKDLRDPKSDFKVIASDFENEYDVIDNIGSTFYMLTNKNAPRYKLVSFDFKDPGASGWKTLVPESKDPLESARIFHKRLILNYFKDVTSKLYCYSLEGQFQQEIQLPGICRLTAFNSDKESSFASYSVVDFTAPERSYVLDTNKWQSKIIFQPDCKFASAEYVTKQVFYQSKDGTRIPMFITHKKNLQFTGETPCFVYGYGGFNISIAPEFRIDRALFLENGGIYCVPNLRGGGEYGEDWHKAGTRCQKQNVFDDFIAACEYLVKNNYTSYKKIAIHGRSNGGLLVGAVMTQRPDICAVAVPAVGVLDMLRFHLFTIGRAWRADYGYSDTEEEFKCIYKYSPLHNVKNISYPATLVLTGDHDDRVVPAHSFKFAATLQEKNTGANPMLIRIDVNAGHGAGKPTSKQIDEFADMWSFIFYNLGIK